MVKEELQIGDEIIAKTYRFPLIVTRVGEKTVKARIKNFPFQLGINKKDIIWRTGQPPERIIKSLRGLEKYEPAIVLKQKKKLRKVI